MRVCVVQSKPIKADIQGNIAEHQRLIQLAIANGGQFIIFPELSLTGYEPGLANELCMELDDPRLDTFQQTSDRHQVSIGVGAPTKCPGGACIGLILFQPNVPRTVYAKSILHPDEHAFFASGEPSQTLYGAERVALAICFEISVPEHAAAAAAQGAQVYIASVAKTIPKTAIALDCLAQTAREHSMTVLMANFVGKTNGADCGGRSAAWLPSGDKICELDDINQGVIVLDLTSGSPTIAHLPTLWRA